ncbi:MAG: HEPN domain-containing protein [bacterium]
MCHLSIEKALKGLYTQKTGNLPPKTHNLLYLVERIMIQLPDNLYDSLFTLSRLSVPTRYPDDLQRMLKDYNEARTRDIIERGKEVLQWLKIEFMKR